MVEPHASGSESSSAQSGRSAISQSSEHEPSLLGASTAKELQQMADGRWSKNGRIIVARSKPAVSNPQPTCFLLLIVAKVVVDTKNSEGVDGTEASTLGLELLDFICPCGATVTSNYELDIPLQELCSETKLAIAKEKKKRVLKHQSNSTTTPLSASPLPKQVRKVLQAGSWKHKLEQSVIDSQGKPNKRPRILSPPQ